MADININKKSSSTDVVKRKGVDETLTSKNQSRYPVVYTDDVWTIVKYDTELSKLLHYLSGCGEVGTYALNVILEALSAFINENKKRIDEAFRVDDQQYQNVQQIIDAFIAELDSRKESESNGVKVRITQDDGRITSVKVTAPDFNNAFDLKGAAEAVRGRSTDPYNKTEKTVWSAYNAAVKAYDDSLTAIANLENSLDTFTTISDAKIRALFR